VLASYYLAIPPDVPVSQQAEDELYRSLKISNGTRKSTEPHRLTRINDLLFDTVNRLGLIPCRAMDIGISSGITTLEWMREFDRRGLPVTMIATDLVMKVYVYQISKNISALTEANGHLLQIEMFGRPVYAHDRFRDFLTGGFIWRRALRATIRSRLKNSARQGPYDLVTPALRRQDRIILLEDNILGTSPPNLMASADIIRVANLIQPVYFTDNEIRCCVRTIRERCRGDGSLVVVCRNKGDTLVGSILRLTDHNAFVLEARLGTGSEVEHFFTS
jgi:hypothetical protein